MSNWKDFDVYIFDFDGTISDTGEGIIQGLQKTLSEFNLQATREQLQPFIGPPIAQSLHKYLGLTDEHLISQIVARYREIYYDRETGYVEVAAMYPGMKELLHDLHKKGKKLAIASLKPQRGLDYLCEKYGIKDWFSAICGPDENEEPGTKDGVIDLVFRSLPKEKSVMIGDSAFDVDGAHVHGIPCIAVHYGFGLPHMLSHAQGQAKTVQQLRELIL